MPDWVWGVIGTVLTTAVVGPPAFFATRHFHRKDERRKAAAAQKAAAAAAELQRLRDLEAVAHGAKAIAEHVDRESSEVKANVAGLLVAIRDSSAAAVKKIDEHAQKAEQAADRVESLIAGLADRVGETQVSVAELGADVRGVSKRLELTEDRVDRDLGRLDTELIIVRKRTHKAVNMAIANREMVTQLREGAGMPPPPPLPIVDGDDDDG